MKVHPLILALCAPFLLILSLIACATTPLTEVPIYTCPTPLPPIVGYRTPVPLPPTPYIIRPPQDFYRGDAVFVGARGAAVRVRFRLQNVYVLPATPATRALYVWSLEVRNLGTAPYETMPIAQMVISRIQTASGEMEGAWNTSDTAMRAAGITGENYDSLPPNTTRLYRMAAYAPVGSPRRFIFTLDEASGNTITWVNDLNPYCSGDVQD
jgi:hypothetical protein